MFHSLSYLFTNSIHVVVEFCNRSSYNRYMFIEVSHESPISMLDKSLESNDYASALVHLFATPPVYYDFYQKLVDH